MIYGPANDSGTTAQLTDEYDALMESINAPLHSCVFLPAVDANGEPAQYLFGYRITRPDRANQAVSDIGRERLVPLMAGFRCAVALAEGEGLDVA